MSGFDDVYADVCFLCDGIGCPYCANGFVLRVLPVGDLELENVMEQIYEIGYNRGAFFD